MRSILLPLGFDPWAKIYEPAILHHELRPRFTITAPEELVPEKVGRQGRVTFQTPRRPRVSCQDTRWLVAKIQELDATNVRRDRIFALHQTRVWFEPTPYNLRGRAGVSLVLDHVEIVR